MKTLSILERLAHGHRWESPDSINLIARAGCAEDIAHCCELQSLGMPLPEAYCRVLPGMWRTLLSNGAMQIFLVENRAKASSSRIISFNATIFASDEFCGEVQSTLPPYVGVQVARHYLSHKLTVLNREQIAQANAGDGLNVMLCFGGGKRDGLSREEILAVCAKQFEAFHIAHSGYRMKEFLAEAIGEKELQRLLGSGARLRRDYSRYFQKYGVPIPETSRRPWLVGLTKEEALANPDSYLSSFFAYTPPRFRFNRSEQVLLHQALMGETSRDLATSLSISPWTVKKRWHAIYQRVADVDHELLLPPVAESLHARSRGTERRRRLLHYLRQHPEELRPFSQLRVGPERAFSADRENFPKCLFFRARSD